MKAASRPSKFAVWTAENGQDDIQWLTGKNLGNGKWQITFDVADHNYDSGLYYIHVNGYDNAGNYRLMKTTTATATGDFKAPVFVGYGREQRCARIYLQGIC